MAVYSAFGVNGNGATGPGSSISYSGSIVVGMAFDVTSSGYYLNGYYLWRSDSSQSATAKFCLYQITSATTGSLVASTTVTGSGFTAGAWNYVALPAQISLTASTPYKAAGGWTNNFNDTNSGAGSFVGSYLAGIVNGPLNVYSPPSSDSGTNPIPYANTYQGSYGTASSDPTADYPLSTDGNGANFWIDVQVGPAGVTTGPPLGPPAPVNRPVIVTGRAGWRNAGHSR